MGERWPTLTLYQRFESLITFILTLIVTLVILVALYRLVADALEFNHTLQYVVSREQSIIQTKIVLLISLLALARKFIILDLKETTPNELLGLAAVTLALGITYWLLREPDDRLGLQTKAQPAKASASKPPRSSRPPTH